MLPVHHIASSLRESERDPAQPDGTYRGLLGLALHEMAIRICIRFSIAIACVVSPWHATLQKMLKISNY